MRYVLDTDVLIEMARNNTVVSEQIRQLRHGGHSLCYSPVTRAEIYAGLRPGEETSTAQLLARFTCLSIDASVGEQAGLYMRKHSSSYGLEVADALIAASCVLADAALITFNVRHYPMPDLEFHHLKR